MTTRARARVRCVLRVAAGPRIGFGHLLRARTLARALGVSPICSVRGGRDAQNAARVLGCHLARGRSVMQGADLLILDDPSRAHARRWVALAHRRGVTCVSVHDGTEVHDVDLAVDGSLGAASRTRAVPALTGVRFSILDHRIALAGRHRTDRRRPHRVLVALGGGGHVRRLARQVVEAVSRESPGASIVVASGFVGGARPLLRNARWLTARRGLVRPLLACDVALVAGGVTLYEACALGVPSVGLAVVPAQRRALRSFARRRAILDAGGPVGSDAAIRRAAEGVGRLLRDEALRRGISAAARRLVDGQGASRVARRIQAALRLRRAA